MQAQTLPVDLVCSSAWNQIFGTVYKLHNELVN